MATVSPQSLLDQNMQAAAFWLLGVNAAFRARGFPKWVERPTFFKHVQTAHEILAGGTYRGPLVLYDLLEYVERLSQHLAPPIKFKSTGP